MGAKKFLDNNGLSHLKLLLGNLFQKREHKTGSESEYKVLSDNNLTDELVKKINDAGTNQFDGEFDSLKGIPTLDGQELKGTLTSEELGLAKSTDIPTDYVSNSTLEEKGYQTASDVETTLSSKKYQTQDQVETLIKKQVSSVIKYKGDVDNYSDLEALQDTAEHGDFYNIVNASEHNKAGDNAVWNKDKQQWDILSGIIDLSGFIKEEDLSELTNDEIDAIFNS